MIEIYCTDWNLLHCSKVSSTETVWYSQNKKIGKITVTKTVTRISVKDRLQNCKNYSISIMLLWSTDFLYALKM